MAASAALTEKGGAEPCFLKIAPKDTVYSFFMFTCPLENAMSPKSFTTSKKALAYFLAIATLLFQALLLYAIYEAVVTSHTQWRNSIVSSEGGGFNLFGGGGGDTCNAGGSLCSESEGTLTCAPPSVQLTGRWDELDTNGDGDWTREEVNAAQKNLQCKYGVDPVEVFQVFLNFLKKREHLIWLHPDVKAGKRIPHTYFQYAAGDLIMCGYRNSDMCANLLERGVFEAPLKYGTSPRVGTTIESALAYCFDLLESGGECERTLPSTYSVWKKASDEQCYGPEYSKLVYTHPDKEQYDVSKSMLTVDYAANQDYSRNTANQLFTIFKAVIILLFFMTMFCEFKDIAVLFIWVLKFPAATADLPEVCESISAEDPSSVKYEIQATTAAHRFAVAMLCVVRLIMVVVLLVVGFTFLAQDTDWVNLVLNAVALSFIMDIANGLFLQVLNTADQDAFLEAEPVYVPQIFMTSRPAVNDMLGCLGVGALLVILMWANHETVNAPLSTALRCACLSEGSHCREANGFNKEFWDQYWRYDVPNVLKDIEQMQEYHMKTGLLQHVAIAPPRGFKAPSPPPATHKQALSGASIVADTASVYEEMGLMQQPGPRQRRVLNGMRFLSTPHFTVPHSAGDADVTAYLQVQMSWEHMKVQQP